jgi:hypothetical protein
VNEIKRNVELRKLDLEKKMKRAEILLEVVGERE